MAEINKGSSKKQGYRETKLGLIPKEWKVLSLGKIGEFSKGKGVAKKDILETDVKGFSSIRYAEIYTLYDYYTHSLRTKINEESARNSNPINNGDILFASSGETLEDIGKSVVYLGNETAYAGGDIIILKQNSQDSKYLGYLLNSDLVRNQLFKLGQGHSVVHIYSSGLKKVLIPLPSLPEQQKIAQILTIWDKAIAAQEKLIAQKQALKKGLMQQLLTGKKRFAGFEDKWIKTELKEIGTIIRGASPRPKGDPKYYGGNVPRLMVKDVTRDGKYVTPKIDFLTEAGAEKSRPCKAGTLTIVCSGDVGVPSFLAVDACIHDGFLAIINLDNKIIKPDFLYYQLKRLRTRMERSATHGGVFTNLTTTILKEFIIEIPSVQEQLAIINVLSKTDKELEREEFKLKNLNSQKQGLMQQLLTGEKRVKI
ncbi:restriction endonuclease subunit S [Leeuwenhoekiella aestuarii]|uniref:Type I restriction enzyme S subunit n=1 Tax=Leeuwenhoekiella aestuarii TaxID=2249426 RepID=A0A4Q0NYI9_9FLAO|nr:restriction endonuclease subunit S [Leeuwenhoekiella aestuarii]RXG17980.1 type I restriction enzyme S subunit [Leeuwenhoekiella aestuarii]